MKPTLKTLQRQAASSARWRGHMLSAWSAHNNAESTAACACGMSVTVNTCPAANGIDIGGEAVAMNCPRKKGRPRYEEER
jgi:hypothetical protein